MTLRPLRFVVSVDREWRVTMGCPELELVRPVREMRRLPDGTREGGFPLPPAAELAELPGAGAEAGAGPGPGVNLPACCELYCRTDDVRVLIDARKHIIGRDVDPRVGTSKFGGYLFHTLIGVDSWRWMRQIAADNGARCVELALSWANGDANLNRLNWEMMHDGTGFLAAGLPGITVAITRLVAGTAGERWEPRQSEFPPRILFVVGTTLNDPVIRPAAEFLGLLRQLRNSGRRIRARVLENARPGELERVIRAFRPHVVHFICHGDWDRQTGRGYLELTPDDPNGDRVRYGDQLYAAMTVGGLPPPLVVLSACHTGSAEAPLPSVLNGAHDLAPLATELVSRGVPLVLGMAGRVSDVTCRLFTRQFGDALVQGESLVVATAEARRATVSQGRSADESVDWAFPALFAAERVDPGFAPVPPGAAAAPTPEEDWIRAYQLGRDPVFCGRNDFFGAYYAFFSDNPRRVLAVVADGPPGVGRTRLLFELATQMLRDGHIPILLASDKPDWRPPQSLREFTDRLARAIREVRRALHLDFALESQLEILLEDRSVPSPGQSALRRDVAAELGPGGELTTAALRLAMQTDLRRLVKDARKRHESVRRVEGRAVVLLDRVEQYRVEQHGVEQDGDLLSGVLYDMLDDFGFGTSDEPVPAVLALAMGQPTNTVMKDTLENVARRTFVYQLPLKPFDCETDEDLLAYSWILLNPPVNVFAGRHVLNDRARPEVVDMARDLMLTRFQGLPRQFADPDELRGVTRTVLKGKFILPLISDEEDVKTLAQVRIEPGGPL